MRKSQLLLIIFGLLQLKAAAQSYGSLEQYYIGSGGTYLLAPIAGYQLNKGFYFEGRYNYEDVNTFSIYSGWSFEKEATLSYSISPMAGLVLGYYKGASVAANISLDYKGLSFFSAPQYTFSAAGKSENFFYNWADLSVNLFKGLSAGFSVQHTKLYQTKSIIEKGFLIQPSYKQWSFPLYFYNPLSRNNRYFVLGLNFEWQIRGRKGEVVTPAAPVPAPVRPLSPRIAEVPKPAAKKAPLHVKVETYTVTKETSAGEPERSTKNAAERKASVAGQGFAIAMGPFKNHDQALAMKAQLIKKLGAVEITTGKHQIWLTGFDSKKEAESFTQNNTFKEFNSSYSIVSYKVKSVEVVTLK